MNREENQRDEKKRIMKKVLLTSVTGFVGAHILEHIMKTTDWEVVGSYRNNQAGTFQRVEEILGDNPEFRERTTLLRLDTADRMNYFDAKVIEDVDMILHVAANSHVDRSIENPIEFVRDNIDGCVNLLEYVRTLEHRPLFFYFGTDEVFGPAPEGVKYKEEDRHKPNNPYAATKSAAEQMCQAYHNTYGIPLIITHTMNIYGERQHPEKFVPLIVNKLLSGDVLHIHASKEGDPGKRHYLHARNCAAAITFLAEHGELGERYNIVGEKEVDNLQMAKLVEKYVKEYYQIENSINALEIEETTKVKPLNYEIVDFHSSRPGHDLRYALDGEKLKQMGFEFPMSFEESLKKTIWWTLARKEKWL